MDDLIKRSDVLKLIHNAGGCDATDEYSRGWDELANHLYSEVYSLPTAYNTDKVVEQLEQRKYSSDFKKEFDESMQDAMTAYNITINDAISIVKGGGIDG